MKWRALFEASPMARDAEESGGFVFGDPASEAAIAALEKRLGVTFPDELKEVYREFDGVGLHDQAGPIWWLVPLDEIEDRTNMLRDSWFDDPESEATARRMVCFGDWQSGDLSGYLTAEDGTTLEPVLHQYDHEQGRIGSWEQSLEQFLRNQ